MPLKAILSIIFLLFSFLFLYKLDSVKKSSKKLAGISENIKDILSFNKKTNYEKGKYYYKRKKYTKVVPYWEKSAEQGNISVQMHLGFMYTYGLGIPKNYKKAFYWWEKAALAGDAAAQQNIGVFYYQGVGIQKNDEKAVYWYKKSANQDFDKAQINLASMYEKGEGGLPKDYKKAIYWYKQAALQDDPTAQFKVAMMYLDGQGVESSIISAYSWFSQGQSHNFSASLNNMQYLQRKMSDKEIISAELHSAKIVKQIETKRASKPKKKNLKEEEIDIFKDLDEFLNK